MRVAIVENHTLPLAQVAIWYRTGSANDPPRRSGLAHALEHMMFRGTRALSGASFDDLEARLGAETNADTDYEYTHFYQTVPADAVGVALRVEADRMRGLLLRPEDWKLERGAVLAELAGYASSDTTTLEDAVRAAAYAGTPYQRDPGGTPLDVRRIGVADLRRAYDAGYAPDDATLLVAGDVDPARMLRTIAATFARVRARAHVAPQQSERVASRGFVVRTQARRTRMVDVALELHGVQGAGALAEELAVELLQPSHALLRDALVRDGPCDSYEVDDDVQQFGGLAHVVCRLDDETEPAKALQAMRAAIAALATHVSASALADARRADRAATDYASDSLEDESDLWGTSVATMHATPPDLDRRIARVPDAAVLAVLRRWSQPVGVGIAGGALPQNEFGVDESRRQSRGEHVPAPSRLEPIALPPWARIAPLPEASIAPVDAFALPNGLRVFVQRRPGARTAYMRGNFENSVWLDVAPPVRERLEREAEHRAIVLDIGTPTSAHGYAADLPVMIAILRDAWRTRPPRAAKNLRSLIARHAPQPRHAWIAVTGDVDSSAVFAQVARAFAGWGNPPEPSTSAPRTHASMPPRLTVSVGPSAPRASAYFVQEAPKREDADFAAMSLLNAILGGEGDFDTRLMREVRERRGLAYGAGSTYDPARGLLGLYFDASSAEFAAARAALRQTVEQLRAGPIGADELARAQRKLLAAALRAEASPDGVLDLLGAAADERRTPDDYDSLAPIYRSVSVADLERVARAQLHPDRMIELDEGIGPRGKVIRLPR